MSRSTTILALVQMLVLVVGFFGLGVILKSWGYPDGELAGVRWTTLAVFLREHGFWLLMLTVLWVFYATVAERKNCGWLSSRAAFVAGLCIATCMLATFLTAAMHPFTRPLLIHIR